MTGERYRLQIDPPGGRLDRVLADRLAELSRSQWQRLIQGGFISVDGQPIEKPAFSLVGGEVVEALVPPPMPSHLEPEAIPLDILYEDDHMLALNKPPGMVVHPGPGHDQGTLVHAVLAYAPGLRGVGGKRRPGVVHRLDKGTSGVILMAKDDSAHQALQAQFQDRSVHKMYVSIVDGHPPTPAGRVEAAIGRDPTNRKRMAIVSQERGKMSFSTYHTRERFPSHSYLEIEPKTGRTHQIRVHLAFLKCPVVGDRVYGRRTPSLPVGRPLLHASEITFCPPGQQDDITVRAPLPGDFRRILGSLHSAAELADKEV
ncbi:MAG: RluA family pseudouridine synthase [Anaerolineales bacterium]